jgi:uncharacterized membrane protein HdeD (DUF308 family)
MSIAQLWWLPTLRGILLVLVGVFLLFQPAITILALIQAYGVFAILDGILALIGAVGDWNRDSSRWLRLAEAAVLLLLGFFLTSFFGSSIAAATLAVLAPAYIAVLSLVAGVVRTAGAITHRGQSSNEWWLVLSGIISIIFGIYIFFNPGIGLAAFVITLAVFAILGGILLIFAGLQLRGQTG